MGTPTMFGIRIAVGIVNSGVTLDTELDLIGTLRSDFQVAVYHPIRLPVIVSH